MDLLVPTRGLNDGSRFERFIVVDKGNSHLPHRLADTATENEREDAEEHDRHCQGEHHFMFVVPESQQRYAEDMPITRAAPCPSSAGRDSGAWAV